MKTLEFPLFKTKSPAGSPKFALNDPDQRRAYFEFKAKDELAHLRKYLKNNIFLALMLGKKGTGKGTYAKLFAEAVGGENIVHFSVGDLVRSLDEEVRDKSKRKELAEFLAKNYRGYFPIEKLIESQLNRSIKTLLPTEFILAVVKREIAKLGRKAIFLDGFPRNLDQVSYSLFFRDLVDFRDDPDFFVLIDVPETIIEARNANRVGCPKCQTPRNLKFLPTKEVGYDQKTGEFYLICDQCKIPMIAKEGDRLGMTAIRDRLAMDGELMVKAFSLYGIPKILLRNCLPVEQAKDLVDDYEITPEYLYQWDEKKKKVAIGQRPWIIKDDAGLPSFSLLPPPVVVSLIKQLADLL
jgi:adenylate kinase family enzyme